MNIIFIILLVLLGASEAVSATPPACTHWASNTTATGHAGTANDPFRISDFWAVAVPGSVLCLTNGTYSAQDRNLSVMAPPPSLNGTAKQPITIRALNDGMVDLNGGGVLQPLFLEDNDYFTFEGFDAHDSGYAVISTGSVGTSTGLIFRRVIAYNEAPSVNDGVWGMHYATNVLLEDVAGFGSGRNIFQITQGANSNTLRRVWGIYETEGTNTGPSVPIEGIYNSSDLILENTIWTWGDSTNSGNPFALVTVGHVTSGVSDASLNFNFKLLGSILYIKPSTSFQPNYLFLQPTNCPPPAYPNGTSTCVMSGETIRNNVAYIDPAHTSKFGWGLGTTTGGIFDHNSTIGSFGFTNPGWTITNGFTSATIGTHNIWTNTGAGAQVCYRYENGTLTSTPLWPWPMDARIAAALTRAGKTGILAGGTVTSQMTAIFGTIPAACGGNSTIAIAITNPAVNPYPTPPSLHQSATITIQGTASP